MGSRTASIAIFTAFAALAGCGLDVVGVPRGTSSDATEPTPGTSPPGPNGPSAPPGTPGEAPPGTVPVCQNSALAFDGVDDVASAPDDRALDLDDDFTIEAWIKPGPKSGTPGEMHVVSHHDPNDGGWELRIKDGRIDIVLWGEEYLSATGYAAGNTGPTYVVPGKWAHVAGTLHDGTLYVYYDGVLRDTQDLPITFSRGKYQGPLTLGRAAAVNDYHYEGQIDDVRLSKTSRYAGGSFTRPTVPFTKDADTVALYTFEEGASSVLVDGASNGHDGALAIAPRDPARVAAPCASER